MPSSTPIASPTASSSPALFTKNSARLSHSSYPKSSVSPATYREIQLQAPSFSTEISTRSSHESCSNSSSSPVIPRQTIPTASPLTPPPSPGLTHQELSPSNCTQLSEIKGIIENPSQQSPTVSTAPPASPRSPSTPSSPRSTSSSLQSPLPSPSSTYRELSRLTPSQKLPKASTSQSPSAEIPFDTSAVTWSHTSRARSFAAFSNCYLTARVLTLELYQAQQTWQASSRIHTMNLQRHTIQHLRYHKPLLQPLSGLLRLPLGFLLPFPARKNTRHRR